MVKKVSIIVIVLVSIFTLKVFAGDIPESLMLGEHKALFIGELISTSEEKSSIKPLTIMMGNISQEEILVDSIDKYYGTDEVPKAGDFIVVVLLSDNEIDDLWIFKATSSNYRTLRLVSEKYNMVKRYQKYINKGAYFKAQERIDAEKDLSTQTTKLDNIDEDKESDDYKAEKVNSNNKRNYSLITPSVLLILIIVALTYKFFLKNSRGNR